MQERYFFTHQIYLREDISRKLDDTSYSFLAEEKPKNIETVQLAQVGIWLVLDKQVSQFSSEEFIPQVENRVNHLGEYDWLRFNETTGIPETKRIEPQMRDSVLGRISKFLSDRRDREENVRENPKDQLRDALLSLHVQNELCALVNGIELQRVTNRLAEIEKDQDDTLVGKRFEFNEACRSLIMNWFANNGLPIPRISVTSKHLSQWDKFELLVREALKVSRQSETQLGEW